MKLKYFFIALVAMVACFSEAFAQQVITVSNAEELKQALEGSLAPSTKRMAAAAATEATYPGSTYALAADVTDENIAYLMDSPMFNPLILDLNGFMVTGDLTIKNGQLSIIDSKGTGAWIGCITVNSGATLAAGSGSIIAGADGVAVINNGTLSTDGGAVIGKITNTGSMPGVATYNTALVANTTIAQAALNAAIDGQVIQFASDIEGDLTAVQKPNTKITIDGADKTMNGTITIDGKSAAYATAGVTIKNLNFDATAITKDASINLGVSGNNNTRYTNNVTIENCTFIDNDYSAVVVKSYTGGDKNLVIKGCTATGMHSLAQLANVEEGLVIEGCTANTKNGINLGSSAGVQITKNTINVKGYGVRIGASSGGESGTITITENTLKTDNTEGDPVIVLRGTAPAQVDLSMTENVVSGTTHISGTTSSTKISAEANYWDGKENPVVAAGSAPVVVNSYYADEAKNDLQRNETGSIYAFVGTDRITGDVTSNAEKSLVIKILDSANNVIGTTSVEKTSHMTGMPKTLTWRINLGADDSDSWAMQWEDGAPTIDNKPAKVQLFVDGVQVSEADVKYTSNGDGKDPVFAAKTDANGKILSFLVSQGYNLDNAATTLVNSVASGDNVVILAAGTYNVPTGKDLTITGKVDGVEFANIGAKNMGGANVTFNNVTFTYANNSTYKGLQHSGNLVYNNCTINGQVFLYGQSETFNNCTFENLSSNYNVWTYGAKEVTFNNCTFNCAGKSVLVYAESESIYNNVAVNNCTFNATQAVEGKAAIEMDSSLTGGANVTITNSNVSGFGTGNVSGNSLWNNKKGNADGKNNDITVTVDGTTVLEPVYDAKIGETGHRTLQEALAAAESGATIDLLADIEASEFININKSVTINGYDHKVISNATRVFRVAASDIEVILKDVNMVSRTVMQYPNDIRGISVDPGLQNVQMTLNNCSVDFTDASACDWAYAVNVSGNGTGHKVTVNGGSYEGANVINVHGANNTIVVKDATLTSLYPNNDQYYGACLWVLQEQGSSVEATGNTFNGSNAIAFNLGTGTALTESDNTDNTTMCVAKIGDVYYSSVNEAINAAEIGATVQLLPRTIDEAIAPWTGDSQHKLEKSITIVGAAGTTLTGGMYLGYNDGTVRDNTITVKGINFEGKGIVVANQRNVVIEGNKFTNIDALVSDKHSNSNCAILVIGTKNDMSIAATIKENEIENVANAGIYLSQVGAVSVNGNTVTDTKHNALTVSAATTATVEVKDNTFAQWGLGGEGRAMRISGAATTNLNANVMSYEGTAPEEFVKVTGATNIDASKNYWDGENPFNSGVYVSDINGDPALQLLSYYTDDKKTDEVTISASVAKIGNTYYASLAAALTAAKDGDVITLNWAEGYAPIAMNGAVFGKNVTITGTATVDWNKGFLFVGRGGEGNATVTFDGANLTSASNSASYGIHVSGREKETNNKYDGTLVIKNSTIELDYLINRNAIELDKATLTVKNGFGIAGRPAKETETGANATATISLANNSKVVVNNHNGMGLGQAASVLEGMGVMNIDKTSAFETTQGFVVTTNGTMNIAGKAVVAGTLTNKGAIVLTNTAATLQSSECGNVTTNVPDYKIAYADGTYKVVAKEYVAVIDESRKFESFAEAIAVVQNGETITFVADVTENVTIVQAPDMAFTIDGADKTMNGTITIDGKSAAYATAGLTIKNVNFIADGITADACVRLGDGTNATRYTNGVTVDSCTFTGTNKEKVGVKNYTGGCKNVTIINSTATGMHSLAQLKTSTTVTLSNNTVTECKNAISLGSSTGVTISECTINVDGYGVRADGGSNVTVTSSAIEAFIPVVVRNASVDSNITFEGTNSMTETNEDGYWCVIGTSEYEEDGKLPTAATGNVVVTLNGTGLDNEGIYGDYVVLAGKGTEAEPFLIKDIKELVAFRNSVNGGETRYSTPGVWVALAADIDLAGENWVGIGSATADHGFMGNFDGKGYKIKNLTITNPALDSDGYAYAGLFGVTEGTDQNNQNTIKNLTIENVTITTTGHIAAAAIAYPYYTIIDNVKVCGDIKIQGGNYTAGVLAYTRRCVNASNLSIVGNEGSFVNGSQTVGGVISDIQMNGGLTADYKNFSAEGLTISGTKQVGGISGIISLQTLDVASVKNVTLSCSDARVGIVSGALGGPSTISNVTYENVTGATNLIGATYDNAKAVAAKIDDTYYATLEDALAAVLDGETITLVEGVEGDESKTDIEFTKDIEFTITGKAPKYALPVITFQNATVNIKDAEVLIPELDARQNATINVIDSKVVGVGRDDIIKSYYNGAINIEGKSEVYTMQVTTMGYINIKGEAKLNATWQANVYGNGMITMAEGATFNTAALHLTGKDYSGRDNTDAERVGMPATIVVDGSNLTVGKVLSNNGADYSYNSSYGINIGTVDGKNAVLDIKNGANVNFFMANGQTANIGAGGTVNIDGALSVACRGEGNVTLVNNGAINLTSEGATLKAQEGLNIATTLLGYFVKYADGVYSVCGEIVLVDGELTEYTNATDMAIKTLTYKRTFQEKMLGKWQTLYVPFEIPVSELTAMGYDVAYFNDFRETIDANGDIVPGKSVIEMVKINGGTLKANYPYVIRAKTVESLEMNLVLNDVTLYSTTGEKESLECSSAFKRFTFYGTYKKGTRADFTGNNNTPVYAMNPTGGMQAMSETAKLGAFRVYMTITMKNGEPYIQTPEQAANASIIPLRLIGEEDENGATIIYDVVEDNLNNNGDDFIYDLQGRRVSEPKKGGIYIKNGKKILF